MTRRKVSHPPRQQLIEVQLPPQANGVRINPRDSLQDSRSGAEEEDSYLADPQESTESSSDAGDAQLICTDLLIPGKGPPTINSNVVIQDGKIVFVGPSRDLPAEYEDLSPTYVPVLMPGMWDCHVHFIGDDSFAFKSIVTLNPATAGARLARSCVDILHSGFTSIRDLGGWACEVAPAVDEGTIPGPHIYSAGAAISQTAGLGDVLDLPAGWAWQRLGIGRHANGDNVGVSPLCIADGVDEVRRAVRLQIRRGATLIKVTASGGVLSLRDDPMLQQFSDVELKTIVEEANRAGRIVAAHVHGKAGIMAAIRAGCKTLEHCTYLDKECVREMKKHDIMLIPTRTIIAEGVKNPKSFDPESYKKLLVIAKYHLHAYQLAIRSGVKIALGTDLGISKPGQALSHGRSGTELSYAVEAGMTELEAIEAATASGPLTLGNMAPKSGQIKEGYDADMIALVSSPLQDIKILATPDKVTHVWKSGKLCKAPGGKYLFA